LIARVKGHAQLSWAAWPDPWTGWLLLRSLETLKPRMETQARERRAGGRLSCIKAHPKVSKVHYLGFTG
jgi:methionine-gamma-lyase